MHRGRVMAHNSHEFIIKLTEILVRQNVVTSKEGETLRKAFEEAESDNFVEFLIDEGIVDKTRLLTALGAYYQVPAFDVEGYFFKYHELHKFPKDFLLRNGIIPLERDENMLMVVASEPDDERLLPAIGNHVSYDIRFLVGIRSDICDAVKEFYDHAITEVPVDQDRREEHLLEIEERAMENTEEEVIRYQEEEDEE